MFRVAWKETMAGFYLGEDPSEEDIAEHARWAAKTAANHADEALDRASAKLVDLEADVADVGLLRRNTC